MCASWRSMLRSRAFRRDSKLYARHLYRLYCFGLARQFYALLVLLEMPELRSWRRRIYAVVRSEIQTAFVISQLQLEACDLPKEQSFSGVERCADCAIYLRTLIVESFRKTVMRPVCNHSRYIALGAAHSSISPRFLPWNETKHRSSHLLLLQASRRTASREAAALVLLGRITNNLNAFPNMSH